MTTLDGQPVSPLVLPDGPARQGYWLYGDNSTNVATAKDTDGKFSLFDFSTAPQGGPFPHIHHVEAEFAYFLDGDVAYQMEDQGVTFTPGDFVYLPKDHVHAFRNLGTTTESRSLIISVPSKLEDFFVAAGSPGRPETTNPPDRPPTADLANLFDRNEGFLKQYDGADEPDSFIFSSAGYSVKKDGTPISAVNILRPGYDKEAVSVTLNLSDGSAKYGKDYSAKKIPVDFAAGERIKTVPISITDNSSVNGNKTIQLSLSDPTGGAILGLLQDKATLTVVGDNSPPPNPLEGGNQFNDFPIVQPSQHQSYLLGGNIYSFVATGADTAGLLSLFDVSVLPQNADETPILAPQDEAYYILDGNVSFQVGNQTFTANPKTFVYLPRGNSYVLKDQGTEPARVVLLGEPSGLENFFAAEGTPISVPEPSFIGGLLVLVACGAVSLRRKKLKQQKLSFSCRKST